jgi:hypothetical protein
MDISSYLKVKKEMEERKKAEAVFLSTKKYCDYL